MVQITINATDEQIKAVDGIVIDHQVWLQAAWDGKAANCTKRILIVGSDTNPNKMTAQEQSDWIRDNTFPSRVDRDAAAAAGGNPPTPPTP